MARRPRTSRRLVCRERSIVRGDGGRFTTPPPSRLEARRLSQHSCSFDHLVGADQQAGRDEDAHLLGGLKVDDHLEVRRLLDRQIRGRRALQDFVDVGCRPGTNPIEIGAVGHQTARLRKGAMLIDGQHTLCSSKADDFIARRIEHRVREYMRGLRAVAATCDNALSSSLLLVTSTRATSNPRTAAPRSVIFHCASPDGLPKLAKTATRFTAGKLSLRASNRFSLRIQLSRLSPVRLPPGRARLATMPVATASPLGANTMGIAPAARRAARVAAFPTVTIKSGFCATRAAAASSSRAGSPSADLASITILVFRTWP